MSGEIARRAGSLKSEFARSGKTLSLADMIVAATALEHGLTLMTDNQKDFPIPHTQHLSVALSGRQMRQRKAHHPHPNTVSIS